MIELDPGAAGEASIPLELDLKPAPLPSRSSAAPPMRGPGSFAPAAVAMALPVERSVPPPAVDPLEARLAAKFGPAPEHFWQTPAYARRVKSRLRELEAEVERRRERAERARREMNDALVSIAVRAIPIVNTLPRQQRAAYIATVDRIRAAEARLRETDAALLGEIEAHNRKCVTLDARIADFEREATVAQGEEQALLRLPANTPGRDQRAATAKTRVDEAKHKLALARDERRALGQWEGNVKGGFKAEEARSDYRQTSADFGHFVVDDTTNFGPEFDAARKEIKRLEVAKEGPKKDLAVYEAALKTYDAAAVQRGTSVLALFVVLVVVVIALTLFLALR